MHDSREREKDVLPAAVFSTVKEIEAVEDAD
jgi:hypothetical protein